MVGRGVRPTIAGNREQGEGRMELQHGQVAVVTGAASGIGLGIAEGFARRGLNVVLADVEAPALVEAEARIAPLAPATMTQVTDVSDRDQVVALATQTVARFGRVDVICNNAGVTLPTKAAWEMDHEDWLWVLGVNLWGVIHGVEAFVPRLVEQGSGHVVNTASIMGLASWPNAAPYTASKHAVVAISETLRGDLEQRGIGVGVTVLCPSHVPTNIADAARNRPAALTPSAPRAPGQRRDRSPHVPVMPVEVGEMVVAAVEAGRFYLTTHPDAGGPVRERMDKILAEIDG